MKKTSYILISCLLFMACQKKTNEHYLYHGLEGFDMFRYINEEFIKDYGVQKIAFLQEANQLQYVLLLNDNVDPEIVEKYSLGLHVYMDKNYISKEKRFLVWDSKPKLQNIGGNKYIINGFNQPITQMDSLVFFIYDREQYKGVIGNRIVIKNIKL